MPDNEHLVFTFGAYVTFRRKPAGAEPDGTFKPSPVGGFPQWRKRSGQTFHLLIDNRYDETDTPGTEKLNLFLERAEGDYRSIDTVNLPVRAGEVVIIDNLPPDALSYVEGMNSSAASIRRFLMVWSELRDR